MSRVVFVGNIPYNFSEEQLSSIFSTVGAIAGFRLVFDRDTGKPKGYGFCEYFDHETAQSAVRNLNGKEVGGRPLRIDLADTDPVVEGRSTSFGELVEEEKRRVSNTENFLNMLPQGVNVPPGKTSLDVITEAVVKSTQSQLYESISDLKAFINQHPDQARILLVANPQLVFAIMQALLLNKIVDESVIARLQDVSTKPPPPIAPKPPPSHIPAWPSASPYYPPVAAPPLPTIPAPDGGLDLQHQALLNQVLSLTDEQIQALPPGEKDAIVALRAQFLSAYGRT